MKCKGHKIVILPLLCVWKPCAKLQLCKSDSKSANNGHHCLVLSG